MQSSENSQYEIIGICCFIRILSDTVRYAKSRRCFIVAARLVSGQSVKQHYVHDRSLVLLRSRPHRSPSVPVIVARGNDPPLSRTGSRAASRYSVLILSSHTHNASSEKQTCTCSLHMQHYLFISRYYSGASSLHLLNFIPNQNTTLPTFIPCLLLRFSRI